MDKLFLHTADCSAATPLEKIVGPSEGLKIKGAIRVRTYTFKRLSYHVLPQILKPSAAPDSSSASISANLDEEQRFMYRID